MRAGARSEVRSEVRAKPAICVGRIAGAHGVKGAVRIMAFTARPEGVAAYGPVRDDAGVARAITLVGKTAKGHVIATLDGVESREAAAALAGQRLWVARERLPASEEPNEYYHADLIGLRAEREDGRVIGAVTAVHDFGAGDVIEIALEGGGTVVIPFTAAAVPDVDTEAGRMIVTPPAGLMRESPGEEGE